MDVDFSVEKRVADGRHRFDFYLPCYNAAIEYDGIQHFKQGHYGSLDETVRRDCQKNSYCAENNISLLRISYTQYQCAHDLVQFFIGWLTKYKQCIRLY